MARLLTGGVMMAVLLASPGIAVAAPKPPALPPSAKTLAEIEAMEVPAGAVARITLFGDPDRAGPYVQILKLAPRARIDPHRHSADRVSTVLKGRFGIGYGSSFDPARLKVLTEGSIFTEPAGADHFGQAGDEPTIVEVSGMGPVTTTAMPPPH